MTPERTLSDRSRRRKTLDKLFHLPLHQNLQGQDIDVAFWKRQFSCATDNSLERKEDRHKTTHQVRIVEMAGCTLIKTFSLTANGYCTPFPWLPVRGLTSFSGDFGSSYKRRCFRKLRGSAQYALQYEM